MSGKCYGTIISLQGYLQDKDKLDLQFASSMQKNAQKTFDLQLNI